MAAFNDASPVVRPWLDAAEGRTSSMGFAGRALRHHAVSVPTLGASPGRVDATVLDITVKHPALQEAPPGRVTQAIVHYLGLYPDVALGTSSGHIATLSHPHL